MDRPTCGAASPTPGASYMVSIMSSAIFRSAWSKGSTGRAGWRSTGSPSCRMGRMAMRSRSPLAPWPQGRSEVGLGLHALDHPGHGELADGAPERRDVVGPDGDQAYRPVLAARDEQ